MLFETVLFLAGRLTLKYTETGWR